MQIGFINLKIMKEKKEESNTIDNREVKKNEMVSETHKKNKELGIF